MEWICGIAMCGGLLWAFVYYCGQAAENAKAVEAAHRRRQKVLAREKLRRLKAIAAQKIEDEKLPALERLADGRSDVMDMAATLAPNEEEANRTRLVAARFRSRMAEVVAGFRRASVLALDDPQLESRAFELMREFESGQHGLAPIQWSDEERFVFAFYLAMDEIIQGDYERRSDRALTNDHGRLRA